MATARHAPTIGSRPGTHFVLDSHHLAMLDRFVARARRDAGRSEQDFRGVVVEIGPAWAVVYAPNLEPLVLGP